MKATNRLLSVCEQLDRVAQLSRDELVEKWIKHYGQSPPKAVSRSLLERAVADAIQTEHSGGLNSRILKTLLKHAEGAGIARSDRGLNHKNRTIQARVVARRSISSKIHTPTLRTGMRLVREWQGKGHVVDVLDHGFQWNGKTYRSLSAVASEITGAKWSGPRFFRV